jgi:RNA polymerase sigma-32 factor
MPATQAFADSGDNRSRHFRKPRPSPVPSPEVEQALCNLWRGHHDISAARQLAALHLHLVVNIAKDYCEYSLPTEGIIGEGCVGLMRAVCRFNPDRGIHFATYAAWWVRVAIQDYVRRKRVPIEIEAAVARKDLFVKQRTLRCLREFDGDTSEFERPMAKTDAPEY